jgi:hypothetical protein
MPGNRRSNRPAYKKSPHFLQTNPDYLLQYKILEKEYNVWVNSSQYWLAKDTERRMNALMNGNVDEFMKISRSEQLFSKTRKFVSR